MRPRSTQNAVVLLGTLLPIALAACGDRSAGRGVDAGERWSLVGSESQTIVHSQGLATLDTPTLTGVVFASQFTIDRSTANGESPARSALTPAMLALGYDHLGDIDAHGDSVYGPIEDNLPPAPTRPHRGFAIYDALTLEVTSFAEDLGDPGHPADGDNSWVAVSPDGSWLLTSEWSPQRSLLVFAADQLRAGGVVERRAEIPLERTIHRVQGCDFDGPRRLLCASDDADAGRPIYAIALDDDLVAGAPLEHIGAAVRTLFPAPEPPRACANPESIEVEGIDVTGDTMQLIVLGPCPLQSTLFTYRRDRS